MAVVNIEMASTSAGSLEQNSRLPREVKTSSKSTNRKEAFSSRSNFALSSFTQLSVLLYQMTYGHIPSVIIDIQFDTSKGQVQITRNWKLKVSKLWAKFVWILTLALSLICVALLVEKFVHHDKAHMNLLQTIFCVLFLSAFCLLMCSFVIVLENLFAFHYYNEFAANQLVIEYFPQVSGIDFPGMFLLYLISGLVFGILPLPSVIFFLDLNPIQIFIESYLLSHEYYRSSMEILASSCVSNVLFSMVVYVCGKALYVYLLIYMVIDVGICNTYQMLSDPVKECTSKKRLLTQLNLQVFGSIVQNLFRNFLLSILTWLQLVLTLCVWVPTRAASLLPKFLVLAFIGGFVGGMPLAHFIIQKSSELRLDSDDFLKQMRGKYHTYNRSKFTYYYYIWWRSQQPFPIYFGRYITPSRYSCISYLSILCGNITNAVLLIIP